MAKPVEKPVDQIALGARIARRRDALNITQEELAEAVGMSQQGIGSIELGEVERPRKLREIAAVLGTTQEWLLWEEGPEEVSESPLPLWQKLNPQQRRQLMHVMKAMVEEGGNTDPPSAPPATTGLLA